ncbi:MAG: aromatic ring-hydroxylating dioxygenase subunit alpha [Myxococcales bacterium]|nr:aromatic ring-hydroxylating dioxygenase subunit alpha [Myxococcales bacterium]
MDRRLRPPPTKGASSVARVTDDWYIACRSEALSGKKPLACTLLGIPLVLFRDGDGRAHALLDRCPHRNVPLSLGAVRDGQLECGYHGWRFSGDGACRFVPGLCGPHEARGRRVEAFATRELDGFVWVYTEADREPVREPFRFSLLDDARYTHVPYSLDLEGTMHAAIENALDVPHTAYLHGGLFRKAGGTKNRIRVVVRRYHDRVEAQYLDEPRPPGLAAKILAPSGGTVEHYDRFILPCIAQVEYKLGDDSHLLTSAAFVPVSDFETRLYSVVSFRLPLPGWLVAPVLRPVALRILKQDAEMLREQNAMVHRFGGEQYISTEADVLGSHIMRLLRNAERGEREPSDEPWVKEGELLI